MTPNVEKDVLEAVKKSLPQIMGDALADFIFEANETKARASLLTETNASLISQCAALQKEIATLKTNETRVAEILKREADVAKRELRIEYMELKVTNANEKVELVKELFKIPFANRVLRESTFGSQPVPVPSGSYVQNGSTSENKTVEEA